MEAEAHIDLLRTESEREISRLGFFINMFVKPNFRALETPRSATLASTIKGLTTFANKDSPIEVGNPRLLIHMEHWDPILYRWPK